MSRENILKHLRCPDPTGQEDWEKRIEQAYHGTHSRWTENLHQSFLGFAIDAICDRCEELLSACEKAQELYRLHEILEYGCGGTSEELAAARRIEEINEQINQAVKKAKGST